MSRTFQLLVAIGLAAMLLAPAAQARRHGPPRWDAQADCSLCCGPGVGRQLMTEEEWGAHQKQMRTLTGEERERARREWHDRMRERAKQRGVTIPPTPGPGCGPGCRGMGPGACPLRGDAGGTRP